MQDFAPSRGDALIVVDVQNDFLPGGALAVPDGDQVIPKLNAYLQAFAAAELPIVATRDWHPSDHSSFASQGGRWPPHCVAGSHGAAFASGLLLPLSTIIVSKGTAVDQEGYSAFEHTDLASQLHRHSVQRVFVGGLATDYCVRSTVSDALAHGFQVVLLQDAVRAVNACPDDGKQAVDQMVARGATLGQLPRVLPRPAEASLLLTDLYQLTMLQAYHAERMQDTAVFEFFVRKLPAERNFLIASGLEQVLDYLEQLQFRDDELAWLQETGRFRPEFVEYLGQLRFTGQVDAMPEGTIFFPHEPVLRVIAPLPEAQLVESRIINLLQFQTLIASKAARCVLVAPDRLLVDFGMRRAHGAEAGLLAARASYLAGFAGSATVLAAHRFNVPIYGTMAHSFIQAHDQEGDAFERFAYANPGNVVLLLDTYDTEQAAEKVVALAPRLAEQGIHIRGVRLDSGDLAEHAHQVRQILDRGGLQRTAIFASGGLDEHQVQELLARGAPINGFGIGTQLDASADAPYLDCAYKLQEYAGQPRRKRSEGKATWPGRKQVYRRYKDGQMVGDVITRLEDPQPGEPLLQTVMRDGQRTAPAPSLAALRQRVIEALAQLPPALRSLSPAEPYPVEIASALQQLADQMDQQS